MTPIDLALFMIYLSVLHEFSSPRDSVVFGAYWAQAYLRERFTR